MKRTLLLSVTFALALLTTAVADNMVLVTQQSCPDCVTWNLLGPQYTIVPDGFVISTLGGISVTGNFGGGGPGEVLTQSISWLGNFVPFDPVLWTRGQGPLNLSFNQGVWQAGAQIQADYIGPFVAAITAWDSASTQLGPTLFEFGTSDHNADGSAIYIGIRDLSAPNIARIQFDIISCVSNCEDFAIDKLCVDGVNQPTPEPGTLGLLGSGVLGLSGLLRRRLLG
jgi:hypothetical protein